MRLASHQQSDENTRGIGRFGKGHYIFRGNAGTESIKAFFDYIVLIFLRLQHCLKYLK